MSEDATEIPSRGSKLGGFKVGILLLLTAIALTLWQQHKQQQRKEFAALRAEIRREAVRGFEGTAGGRFPAPGHVQHWRNAMALVPEYEALGKQLGVSSFLPFPIITMGMLIENYDGLRPVMEREGRIKGLNEVETGHFVLFHSSANAVARSLGLAEPYPDFDRL